MEALVPRPPRMDLTEQLGEALDGVDLSHLENFEFDQEEPAEEAQPDEGQDPEKEAEPEAEADEAEAEEDESPPEAPEGETDLDGDDHEDDRESDEEAATSEEDVPDSFMGLDLSEVPVEKRKEIIDRFKEQDRYANREHQRAKELEKQLESQEPEPPAEEELPEEISDEDLLAKLGYDKDDPMFEVKAEVALPLAKEVLKMRQALQTIVQERMLDQFEQTWNSTLDRLEGQHGKLPIGRDELLEFAADNNIDDAETAYLKYMTPRKKAISDEVQKLKAEAMRELKKKSTTQRPRTAKVKTKPQDAKDMKEAFKMVEKEQGVDMDKLIKNLAANL